MTTQDRGGHHTRTCASCDEWCLWWTDLCACCRAIDSAAKTFDTVGDVEALAILIAFSKPASQPLGEHTCDLDERTVTTDGKEWIRIDVDCDACTADGRMGLRCRRALDHLRRLGPTLASAYLHLRGRSHSLLTADESDGV